MNHSVSVSLALDDKAEFAGLLIELTLLSNAFVIDSFFIENSFWTLDRTAFGIFDISATILFTFKVRKFINF
jgi:hypothetical protein